MFEFDCFEIKEFSYVLQCAYSKVLYSYSKLIRFDKSEFRNPDLCVLSSVVRNEPFSCTSDP